MQKDLSVITICFNNPDELIRTCRSVDEQTASPKEHWIIDGSSEKQILHWLENNPQPGWRKWMHERDKGISDAFNKGILQATGTVTHLLNSGDTYTTNQVIDSVMKAFEDDPQLMWTHGKYIQHRGGTDVISGTPFEKNKLWRGMRQVAHPTMFIKKELYDRYGLYRTDLKIAMDYDLLVRIRDEKCQFIPHTLVYFAPGGASSAHFKKGLKEVRDIYKKHLGFSFRQYLWQLRQLLLQSFIQTPPGKAWQRWKSKPANSN